MKTGASLMAITLLAGFGCAGPQVSDSYGTASPQPDAAKQTADYRAQANSLREMADRRQLEADLLARELGANEATVGKKRRLAEELRAAAVEADSKAHDSAGHVPHGMVQ
ncbi:MAG TPA: hypothetical protein VJR03_01805 [Nitrospira sp.]|nr:hypothetical protein [Nitrospira sp.]